MGEPTTPQDLARSSLSVLFMVGLIAASFWILRPFIPALLWATMIVVAAWPFMLQVEAFMWGRRALAVTVMTLVLLLIFVVPFSLAVATLVAHLDEIVLWAQSLRSLSLPSPPGWVESIPFLGPKTASVWSEFASSGPEELARYAAPYARVTGTWLLGQLGSLGAMTGQFLLTVLIAAVLFARGDLAYGPVHLRAFYNGLAGPVGPWASYAGSRSLDTTFDFETGARRLCRTRLGPGDLLTCRRSRRRNRLCRRGSWCPEDRRNRQQPA